MRKFHNMQVFGKRPAKPEPVIMKPNIYYRLPIHEIEAEAYESNQIELILRHCLGYSETSSIANSFYENMGQNQRHVLVSLYSGNMKIDESRLNPNSVPVLILKINRALKQKEVTKELLMSVEYYC